MANVSDRYLKRKLNIKQTREGILQQSLLASKAIPDSFDSIEKAGSPVGGGRLDLTEIWPSADRSYNRSPKNATIDSMTKSFVEAPYDREISELSSTVFTTRNAGATSSMSIADLSNLSLLVEKDPEVCGGGALFTSFKDTLGLYPNAGQVFEMVEAYEKICRDHIKNLLDVLNQVDPSRTRLQKTANMINFLHQECCTWRLVNSLIKDRLMTENAEVDMDDGEYVMRDQFSSKKEAIEKLFNREPSVRYCQMIVDWLEKNADDKLNDLLMNDHIQFSSDSVSWEHTLHGLMHPHKTTSTRTITEMDPDAPVRQKRHLADLDQVDETRLLQFIFSFLRAGRLEEAKKMCVQYGQSWRAATLDGWRLWHDPNFEMSSKNEEVKHTEGNAFGNLWKQCCWKMCEDDGISMHEKAIYAALSGNLKQLLSVLESWDDCLWAFFRVLVDTKVEQELSAIHDLDTDYVQLHAENEDLTTEKIFQELESHQSKCVKNEGKEPFHLIQKYLILDEPKNLLKTIKDNVDGKGMVSVHMLRFMTHAVIFFQTVGLDIDDALYTKVIRRYIEVLIEKDQGDQVAVYASKLSPDDQIEIYCQFLMQIDNLQDRQHYLELARNSRLDVQAISKAVVEGIRENNPSDLTQGGAETDGDRRKIDAIDLLTIESSRRIDAVIQANAIILGFLASKKLELANEVFKKLPEDSIDVIHQEWEKNAATPDLPHEYENAIKEHLCIKAYLYAHDAFNSWFEHFNYKAPTKPARHKISNFKDQIAYEETMNEYNGRYQMWKKHLGSHVENVSDKIYNVLLFPEGWMIDSHPVANDPGRAHQIDLLRQIAIPMLCFMLHSVLHSSEQYKECLQLADTIQAEQHKLYSVFKREDLKKLLGLFKDSSLALLNLNKNLMGF
eukprot:gene19926-21878_t